MKWKTLFWVLVLLVLVRETMAFNLPFQSTYNILPNYDIAQTKYEAPYQISNIKTDIFYKNATVQYILNNVTHNTTINQPDFIRLDARLDFDHVSQKAITNPFFLIIRGVNTNITNISDVKFTPSLPSNKSNQVWVKESDGNGHNQYRMMMNGAYWSKSDGYVFQANISLANFSQLGTKAVFEIRLGNYSTVYNFTTGNTLASNSVNDVFVYDLTKDSTDYHSWYNDSSKSWWLEANDTIVDSSLSGTSSNVQNGDYVSVSNEQNFDDENFSIDFWYKNNDAASFGLTGKSTGANVGWILYNNGPNLNLFTNDGMGCLLQTTWTPAPIGVWKHIAVVRNSSLITLYMDGVDQGTQATCALGDVNNESLVINAVETGSYIYSSISNLDEYHYYKRLLTPEEINDSYNNGLMHQKSNVTGAYGYWSFDEDAKDNSGNGNDGIFNTNAKISGRSSKKEFPLLSYIVASNAGVDIIDAETNKLWMRGNGGIVNNLFGETAITSISALNGIVYAGHISGGTGGNSGLSIANFITDLGRSAVEKVWHPTYRDTSCGNISQRNSAQCGTVIWDNKNDLNFVLPIYSLETRNIGGSNYLLIGHSGGITIANSTDWSTGSTSRDFVTSVSKAVKFINDTSFVYGTDSNLSIKEGLPSADFTADKSITFSSIQSLQSNSNQIFAGLANGGVCVFNISDLAFDKQYVKSTYTNIQDPIFWNTLDNNTEIQNSRIGANGIVVGASAYAPAKFKDGISGTDMNNYVSFANVVNNEAATFEFWYKPAYDSSSGYMWLLYDTGGNLGVYHYSDFFKVEIPPLSYVFKPSFSSGELLHLAFTIDNSSSAGNRVKMYKNGIQVPVDYVLDDTVWSGTMLSFFVGGGVSGTTSHGNIDNIKVYDYVKTDFSNRFTEDGSFANRYNILAGDSDDVRALSLADDNISLYVGTNDNNNGGGISDVNIIMNSLRTEWVYGLNEGLLNYNINSLSYPFYNNILLIGTGYGAALLTVNLTPITIGTCIGQENTDLLITSDCSFSNNDCSDGICNFNSITITNNATLSSGHTGNSGNDLTLVITNNLNITSGSSINTDTMPFPSGPSGTAGIMNISAQNIIGNGSLSSSGLPCNGICTGGYGGSIIVTTSDMHVDSLSAMGGRGYQCGSGGIIDTKTNGTYDLTTIDTSTPNPSCAFHGTFGNALINTTIFYNPDLFSVLGGNLQFWLKGISSNDAIINYPSMINFNDKTTAGQTSLLYDYAGLNSSYLPEFDIPSIVTLYNIPTNFSNPAIFKDGSICLDCTPLTSLNAGTVSFSVTGFNYYSIAEGVALPPVNQTGAYLDAYSHPLGDLSGDISIDKMLITTDGLFATQKDENTSTYCNVVKIKSNLSRETTLNLSLSLLYQLTGCAYDNVTYSDITSKCSIATQKDITVSILNNEIQIKPLETKSINVCINIANKNQTMQYYQALIVKYDHRQKIIDMFLAAPKYKLGIIPTSVAILGGMSLLIFVLFNKTALAAFLNRPI